MTNFQIVTLNLLCTLAFLASFQSNADSRAEPIHQGKALVSNSLGVTKKHSAKKGYEQFQLEVNAQDGCSITDPRCGAKQKAEERKF